MSIRECRRHIALVAAGMLLVAASTARAQDFTLGDILSRARSGAATADLEHARPVSAKRLADLDAYFSATHTTNLSLGTLGEIYTPKPKSVSVIARWNRGAVGPVVPPGFADSLTALNRVISSEITPALTSRISEDSLNKLFQPIDQFGTIILTNAQAANQEKLRRFSVKYGPGSPQLNLVEVGLNYLAQLKVPGFAPTRDGYTSPYEIVATYRTTDLTASKADSTSTLRGRAVTTGQLGVRKYNFAPDCGTGSRFSELLNPCQSSLGWFVMGPTDSPLLNPLKLGTRSGVYLSRGKYHFAGVVFGQGKRFVFGLDQQIIPYIF